MKRDTITLTIEVLRATALEIASAIEHALLGTNLEERVVYEELRVIGEALLSEYRRYQNLKGESEE